MKGGVEMNYLRGRRVGMGLSSSEVAEYLGIPVTTYCYRERNQTGFSDEEKIRLAKLFDWTPIQMNKYLYGGMLPISENNTWEDIAKMQSFSSD